MQKTCQSKRLAHELQASVTWKIKVHNSLSHGINASVTPAQTFAEGKFKTSSARRKYYFFPLQLEIETYINLYSFESSMKWPFTDIFSFSVNKISDYAERAEADQALQKSLRKP